MLVVCVIRTEGMRGYTLGKTYNFILGDQWSNGGVVEKNDNDGQEFWSLYDINKYFKPLRDYNLQSLVE